MTTENEEKKHISLSDIHSIITTMGNFGLISSESAQSYHDKLTKETSMWSYTKVTDTLRNMIEESNIMKSCLFNGGKVLEGDDLSRYIKNFKAVDLVTPEMAQKEIDKANDDQQSFFAKTLETQIIDALSEYLITCARNKSFNADNFVNALSRFSNIVNDDATFRNTVNDEVRNSMFEKALKKGADNIFLGDNGIQVYDTLIKRLSMRRLPETEFFTCIGMIVNFCDQWKNENTDKNDYLSGLRRLLDYGTHIEYDGYSLLAHALFHATKTMQNRYSANYYCLPSDFSSNMDEDEYKRKNTYWFNKQWKLLNLFGNKKYNPDWSVTIANGNLLTLLIDKEFFDVPLASVLRWVVNKSKEQGHNLLKTTDRRGYTFFNALDKLKNKFEPFESQATRHDSNSERLLDFLHVQHDQRLVQMISEMRLYFIRQLAEDSDVSNDKQLEKRLKEELSKMSDKEFEGAYNSLSKKGIVKVLKPEVRAFQPKVKTSILTDIVMPEITQLFISNN